jgi:hypothetical protein
MGMVDVAGHYDGMESRYARTQDSMRQEPKREEAGRNRPRLMLDEEGI